MNEGNVFRSADYGVTWGQRITSLPYLQMQDFADIGSNMFVSIVFGGVYRSTNDGVDWNAVNNGLSSLDCYPLFVNGTTLFVGAYWAGAFRSTDYGANWTSAGLGGQFPWSFAANGSYLFAGCVYASGHPGSGGVYRSTNNGTSWTAAGLTGRFIYGLAVKGSNLFVATVNEGVYLSTNNGDTWASVNNGIPVNTEIYTIYAVGENLIAGSAANGVGPFLSTDNGSNWVEFRTGLTSSSTSAVLAVTGTDLFLGSYGEGVWRRPLLDLVSTTKVWSLKVRASTAAVTDNENYAGLNSVATEGFDDALDLPKPPAPPGNYVQVYFPHSEWGSPLGSNFATDFRPNTALADTVKRWRFEVKTNVVDTVTLTFQQDRIPAGFGIRVTDVATGQRYDLRQTSVLKFYANSETPRTFLLAIGDSIPPSIDLTSPNGGEIWQASTQKTITWTSADRTGVSRTDLYQSNNSGSGYSQLATLGGGQSWQWTLPSVYLNEGYKVKVVVQDSMGNSSTAESASPFTIVGDSLAVSSPAGWSLVSLPLVPPDTLKGAILGDDFGANPYYVWGYDQSTGHVMPDGIRFGRGYWLGLTATRSWDVRGLAQEADSILQPLSIGYTLVGNNFVRQIPKEQMRFLKNGVNYSFAGASSAGLITNALYGYSGTAYQDVSAMSTFGGYWLGVVQAGVLMVQRRSAVLAAPAPLEGQMLARTTTADWQLGLRASSGGVVDQIGLIGAKAAGTADFDPAYDVPRPPRTPESKYIELYFPHSGQKYPALLGTKYARDIRGPEGATWGFTVESSVQGEMTIEWDNSALAGIQGLQLKMTDLRTGTVVDMAGQSNYSFTYAGARNFTITSMVTEVEAADSEIPQVFGLAQNYPNPFNPSTMIQYQLPASSYVTLSVFSTLGERIAVLVEGQKAAGYHQVDFNATSLSSGMYFYRLQAGSYTETKKLLLVR